MVLMLELTACARNNPQSHTDVLMDTIYASLPDIHPGSSIVSLRYEKNHETLTVLLINKTDMKEYTVAYVDGAYFIDGMQDVDQSHIDRLMKCNEVFDSVYIGPQQAIDIVNRKNSTHTDLAVMTPYLSDQCKNEWSVHGPGGMYLVDAQTGDVRP
jgi:hypothetical protein